MQRHENAKGHNTFGNGRKLTVALAQGTWPGMDESRLWIRIGRSLNQRLRLDLSLDLATKAMGRYSWV